MIECEICKKKFASRLGSHIKTHNISIHQYYDTYIKEYGEGICICGKPTKFLGLTKGYQDHCSLKCAENDPNIIAKKEQTCLEKYGATNVYASEYGKAKIKETNMVKYNVENPQQNIEIRNKTIETNLKLYGKSAFVNDEKSRQTKLDKYGSENPTAFGSDIFKQSMINIYNVDNPQKYNEIKEKYKSTCIERYGVDNPVKNKEIMKKIQGTVWKNNGYHKTEDRCYNELIKIYPDAIHMYKSELYPYKCDFYIPSEDLYIELNFFWMHGGHWFDSNNVDDISKLNLWKSKKSSQFEYAIKVWTQSDIEKRDISIKNKLNYLVFWNEQEFIDWINLSTV